MNDKCFSSLGSNEATLLQAEAREKVKELRKPEWKKLRASLVVQQHVVSGRYRLKAGGLEEEQLVRRSRFQAARCSVAACVLLLVTYFLPMTLLPSPTFPRMLLPRRRLDQNPKLTLHGRVGTALPVVATLSLTENQTIKR